MVTINHVCIAYHEVTLAVRGIQYCTTDPYYLKLDLLPPNCMIQDTAMSR